MGGTLNIEQVVEFSVNKSTILTDIEWDTIKQEWKGVVQYGARILSECVIRNSVYLTAHNVHLVQTQTHYCKSYHTIDITN
jgi:hypothetical protein